jgi:hypothetical protein
MNTADPTAGPSPSLSSSSLIPPLVETVERNGKLGLRWNVHRGQRQALDSKKRFVVVQAGWQSGKSEIGPPWLWREMMRCGPGDYLIASPTFPLMMKKVLPIFQRLFERQLKVGTFVGGKNIFIFSDDGCRRLWGHVPDEQPRVLFGHAGDPESLESATIKAAWLDEAGQNGFRVASYEAVLGRLSIYQGRVLLTTRPYNLGWLKQLLWDPWEAAGRNHPDIDVVNFRSIDNPAFPAKEYYRAKAEMPQWKFLMAYDGLFTRPAGLIYSSFDTKQHVIPRVAIPPEWHRHVGLDFGGVNTAAVFFAEEQVGVKKTGRLIAYREYKAGERSAAEHTHHLLQGDGKNPPEPRIPHCVGGSKSEGQWRLEFKRGGEVKGKRVPGLPIHAPAIQTGATDSLVEVGINRVFGAFARGEILVFDDLTGVLDELASYSRELDDLGEPTEKIDAKETYHYCDSIRYVIGHLKPPAGTAGQPQRGAGVVREPYA